MIVGSSTDQQSRFQKFRGSAGPYAASTVVERISTLYFLSYLGRNFGSSWLGAWSQIGLISGLFVPVITLQAAQSLIKFLPDIHNTRARNRFITVLSVLPQVFMLLVLLVGWVIRDNLARLLFPESPLENVLLLLAFFLWSEIQADLVQSELRARQRIATVGALSIFRSLVRIVWIVACVEMLGFGVSMSILSYLVVQFIVLTTLLFLPRRSDVFEGDSTESSITMPSLLGANIRFAFPLVFIAVVSYANSFMDRYAIVPQFGLESLAIYSVTYGTLGVVVLFYAVYGYSVFPKISAAIAQNRPEDVNYMFTFLLNGYFRVVLIVGAWWTAVGPAVLKSVFGIDYSGIASLGVVHLLIFLCLGVIQIATYVLQLSLPTSRLVVPVVASAFLTIVLLFAIRDRFGLVGIATANLVPTFILAVWYLWMVSKYAVVIHDRFITAVTLGSLASLAFVVVSARIASTEVVLCIVASFTLCSVIADSRSKKWSVLRNLGAL